jgi:hypothetical protein
MGFSRTSLVNLSLIAMAVNLPQLGFRGSGGNEILEQGLGVASRSFDGEGASLFP